MTPSNLLCIVGTDTGIGKTLVGASLCSYYRSLGLSVGVFKPSESGCLSPQGISPSDSIFLQKMSHCGEPLEKIVPYQLSHPLSPAEAAFIDNVNISRDLILENLRYFTDSYDFVLMEGSGGLLVPFGKDWCFADLIESIQPKVLVVARSTLGTVNHTLLTLSELDRRDIPVCGFVLNRLFEKPSLEEETNPSSIEAFTPHSFLGFFPFVSPEKRDSPQFLSSTVSNNLDSRFLSSFFPH